MRKLKAQDAINLLEDIVRQSEIAPKKPFAHHFDAQDKDTLEWIIAFLRDCTTSTPKDESKTIPPLPTMGSDAYRRAPTEMEELVGNVEDIRNHLRANSTRITDLKKSLTEWGSYIDKIGDKIADMCAELSKHKTDIKSSAEDINKIKAELQCVDNIINSTLEDVCEEQCDIKERLDRIEKHLGGEVITGKMITFEELPLNSTFYRPNVPFMFKKVKYLMEDKFYSLNLKTGRFEDIKPTDLVIKYDEGDYDEE